MEDIVSYRTLEKEFYANSSSDRYTAHDALLSKRFDSDSTFKTGIALSTGELFLAVPRELSIATEHVLRRERRVSALWRALPPHRAWSLYSLTHHGRGCLQQSNRRSSQHAQAN